jgi:hypothetical protein
VKELAMGVVTGVTTARRDPGPVLWSLAGIGWRCSR